MSVRPGTIRPALAVLAPVVVALGLSSVQPAFAAGAPHAATAAPAAANAMSTCFWRLDTGKGKDNAAFPDLSGAIYWTAMYTLPAGARVNIAGVYPHARYMSLNAYDTTGVATSVLTDVDIAPDAGSTNPFLPGADRTATARGYSMSVLDQVQPAVPATNTLYAGVSGQTTEVLVYRVYVADQGTDRTGGVGLPQVSLTLADNSTLTGGPMCKAVSANKSLPPSPAYPLPAYLALRDQAGQPATFPAQDPPAFWREFSIPSIVDCLYDAACGGTPTLTPGQYSNLDNAYVVAAVNRGFSDGPVLVLHGKMPITPKTLLGAPTMASGVDMRYWSICQNESIATGRAASCVNDEQVPVDANGDYTIVTSAAHDKPKNATAACGVAWLQWPKNGDGEGHLDDGVLIMRNMLPDPGFASAVQDVTAPGMESAVMGSYLPTGTYTTKAAFQALGAGNPAGCAPF